MPWGWAEIVYFSSDEGARKIIVRGSTEGHKWSSLYRHIRSFMAWGSKKLPWETGVQHTLSFQFSQSSLSCPWLCIYLCKFFRFAYFLECSLALLAIITIFRSIFLEFSIHFSSCCHNRHHSVSASGSHQLCPRISISFWWQSAPGSFIWLVL